LPLGTAATCQLIVTEPVGPDSEPYLAAFVDNSCSAMPRYCAASGVSMTSGPSTLTRVLPGMA
jgi:hypothetical protein